MARGCSIKWLTAELKGGDLQVSGREQRLYPKEQIIRDIRDSSRHWNIFIYLFLHWYILYTLRNLSIKFILIHAQLHKLWGRKSVKMKYVSDINIKIINCEETYNKNLKNIKNRKENSNKRELSLIRVIFFRSQIAF